MTRNTRRHLWTRRRFLTTVGALAGGAILAACGGNDSSGGGDSQEDPTPTVDPRRGGQIRVALTGDPPNLDIHQTTDSIVVLVASHMYETLFTWDADYRPVPLLAASHEESEDGLLHTLKLRADVPFHNGETLKAEDVVASIERWSGISGLGEGLMEAVDKIEIVDDLTLEFHMSQPFGTFRMALARQLQGCAIYPKSVLDASDSTSLSEYVGTGPYKFVEWLPDQHILMERFDDYASPGGEVDGYAGPKAQYADRLEFIPVRTEASRVAGLQAGDYHYVETLSPDQVPVLETTEGVAIDVLPSDSWLNIVLNLRSPVLEDLRVRRAIQVALDHEAIMLAAFGEGYYELTPELVPGAPTWYTEAGAEFFNQNDPDRARELLEEAGYDGTPLRIMVTEEIQQEYNGTLTMAQQLEEVGFNIELLVYDGATLSDQRNDETAWEMYAAWASFRPDPVMRNLTSSATGWWENEEKDELLAQLQSESDYDRRFEIWEQVQYLFYEEVPRLKIGNSRRVVARSAALQDIGPTEMQPEFSNAWLDG